MICCSLSLSFSLSPSVHVAYLEESSCCHHLRTVSPYMYLAWYGRTADFLPHDVHVYISSTFARVKDDDRHYRTRALHGPASISPSLSQ